MRLDASVVNSFDQLKSYTEKYLYFNSLIPTGENLMTCWNTTINQYTNPVGNEKSQIVLISMASPLSTKSPLP